MARLDSIDALRGFDMFFITGGAALLLAVNRVAPCGFTDALAAQMSHTAWDGFTFYDMIFPLFLFIAGISYPFSISSSRSKGFSQSKINLKTFRRVISLIALGWVFNGIFKLDFDHFRLYSVLGRIGIAWGCAALIYSYCDAQSRGWISFGILLGYALLTALVAAPDSAGAAALSKDGNIVGYIDRTLLPGRLLDGNFDPLGLVSTLPAIVTALFGMFAGDVVRRDEFSGQKKSLILCIAGIAGISLGLLLGLIVPINKPLWSSSYVLFAGGISAMLFALFYWIIDVLGYRKWAFYFKVIGLNSITIYMLQKIVDLKKVTRFFFGGLAGLVPDVWGGFILAVGYLSVCFVILYFLYRKKIFLKV